MTKKNLNIFNKDFVFEETDQFGEIIETKKVRNFLNLHQK